MSREKEDRSTGDSTVGVPQALENCGPLRRCTGGWLGVCPKGADVTGRSACLVKQRSCGNLHSLEVLSCTEPLLLGRFLSLAIMFLRSSVSRLLHGQIPCVQIRSVHSVAIVGAPFSRGQVRIATRADGTLNLESFLGLGRRREGRKKKKTWGRARGIPWRAPGAHVGFSPTQMEMRD